MPKAFPPEFGRNAIAVARKGETSMAQIARDIGISESCLARWLKIADPEEGRGDNAGGPSDAELRELRKRNKLLERRTRSSAARRRSWRATCSQNDVPAGR